MVQRHPAAIGQRPCTGHPIGRRRAHPVPDRTSPATRRTRRRITTTPRVAATPARAPGAGPTSSRNSDARPGGSRPL